MSRYTIQLRSVADICGEDVVKSWFMDYELSDYLTDEEIAVIASRGTWSKEKLANLIFDHYYMYEIGFETPALFRHQAKVAMREIMEEKAPLIYSAAIKYDPLVNVDYTETFERNTQSDTTSNSNGLVINSDTPQQNINKTEILAGKYASSTTGNEGVDTATGTGAEQSTRHMKGNSGVSATAQRMVQQYRDNIIMINRDIVNDLKTLFMGVF